MRRGWGGGEGRPCGDAPEGFPVIVDEEDVLLGVVGHIGAAEPVLLILNPCKCTTHI